MDNNQINTLIEKCRLPDSCTATELRKTHISWIILTDHYAFKIKRPVKLPFLDFSSLEKRKYFCERELELNARLAPRMYLEVIAITENMVTGDKGDGVIDYAVMMTKMDNRKEMGDLLHKDQVTGADVDKLADTIAQFHRNTAVVREKVDISRFQKNFAELLEHRDFVRQKLGPRWLEKIEYSVKKAKVFLEENQKYLEERNAAGLRKDCHGDLSSHNIFLYDDPVIFDCIEFNDSFRHIDILNEVAFLGTEFDFYDKQELGERFYQRYLHTMELKDDAKSRRLLSFFKSYRANIRAKVNILHVKSGAVNRDEESRVIGDIEKYIELMFSYLKKLCA